MNEELQQAIENNEMYGYIANNYNNLTKYELAQIIKEYSYFTYKMGFKDKEVLKDLDI